MPKTLSELRTEYCELNGKLAQELLDMSKMKRECDDTRNDIYITTRVGVELKKGNTGDTEKIEDLKDKLKKLNASYLLTKSASIVTEKEIADCIEEIYALYSKGEIDWKIGVKKTKTHVAEYSKETTVTTISIDKMLCTAEFAYINEEIDIELAQDANGVVRIYGSETNLLEPDNAVYVIHLLSKLFKKKNAGDDIMNEIGELEVFKNGNKKGKRKAI